jgi:hypothetical protein
MASQLFVQARASGSPFGPDQPFDGGAVLEEAGSSAGIARGSRGGDLHAALHRCSPPIRQSLARVNSLRNDEGRRNGRPSLSGAIPRYGVSRLSGSLISTRSGRESPAATIVRSSSVVVAVVPAGVTTSRSS